MKYLNLARILAIIFYFFLCILFGHSESFVILNSIYNCRLPARRVVVPRDMDEMLKIVYTLKIHHFLFGGLKIKSYLCGVES